MSATDMKVASWEQHLLKRCRLEVTSPRYLRISQVHPPSRPIIVYCFLSYLKTCRAHLIVSYSSEDPVLSKCSVNVGERRKEGEKERNPPPVPDHSPGDPFCSDTRGQLARVGSTWETRAPRSNCALLFSVLPFIMLTSHWVCRWPLSGGGTFHIEPPLLK